jgi:hypothetical protein
MIECGKRHRACRAAYSAQHSYLAGRQRIKAIRREILGFFRMLASSPAPAR